MNFLQWLTLLFIYLGLTGAIDWHWLFIVSPMFASFILVWLSNIAKEARKIEETKNTKLH